MPDMTILMGRSPVDHMADADMISLGTYGHNPRALTYVDNLIMQAIRSKTEWSGAVWSDYFKSLNL